MAGHDERADHASCRLSQNPPLTRAVEGRGALVTHNHEAVCRSLSRSGGEIPSEKRRNILKQGQFGFSEGRGGSAVGEPSYSSPGSHLGHPFWYSFQWEYPK